VLINEYLFFCRVCHEKVCREKLALFGTEKRKSGSIAYRKLQRERRVGGGGGGAGENRAGRV